MKKSLICSTCGKEDKSTKTKNGTSLGMICPDCNDGHVNKYGSPLAQRCRECCPTGHGTR